MRSKLPFIVVLLSIPLPLPGACGGAWHNDVCTVEDETSNCSAVSKIATSGKAARLQQTISPRVESRRLGSMTTKEKVHRAVDQLSEEQAVDLLRLIENVYESPKLRPLPTFVGMGDSGRSDVSEKVDEYLRDGFGR